MQYLTYGEYQNIGGTLEETAFKCYISRVCGIIDNATFGRIESLYGVPAAVKELCRDLVEYLAGHEGNQKAMQSRSQSAGGVSESVSYANATDEDIKSHIDNMIFDYLYSVKCKNGLSVLYRGAMS